MAHDTQALTLDNISKAEAAQAFTACAGLDPEGLIGPQEAAAAGECYVMNGAQGKVVFSVQFGHGCAWVMAAAGTGQGMTEPGLWAIEQMARAMGCHRVGFQTMRKGFARKVKKLGYHITGQIGHGVRIEKNL